MANTNFITQSTAGVNLSSSDGTTAQFPLGSTFKGTNGTEWVYILAGGAVTIYDYVCINSAWSATSGTKANVDKGYGIGFAQFAIASGEYAWVAIRGVGLLVNALTLCVLDVALYTSATAGAVDDLSTSQTQLRGLTLNTTNAAGGTVATAFKAFTPVFGV